MKREIIRYIKKENREEIYYKECGSSTINEGEALKTIKGVYREHVRQNKCKETERNERK
jgi:hypothetical protein